MAVSVSSAGCVYFVGAGLGAPAYLTCQATEILRQADVVIHDALVDSAILDLLGSTVEHILVGKRGGKPSTPQTEINQLLVDRCQGGQQVVRLKSGDPWIFGRLTAEIEALQAASCSFRVIPGISSAIAAAGLMGIPLTDKVNSAGFMVLSGHEPARWEWDVLSRLPTLVILMAGRTLPDILQRLQAVGKAPTTPIAIIKNAGRINQETWHGSLADMVEKTQGCDLSPAIVIIGSVADYSLVSSPPPLANKTILVTRAAEQASPFSTLLQHAGATVVEMPALTITPPSTWQPLDQAIATLDHFQWLILTSANGVNFFFERLHHHGLDSRALGSLNIAVVGKKTATVLQQYGLQPDVIPQDFIADALIPALPANLAGQKILFPRVEQGGRQELVQDLRTQGAIVIEVPAYQSLCPSEMPLSIWQGIQAQRFNAITFASAKTVSHFAQLLLQRHQTTGEPAVEWQQWLNSVCLASIGPQTSKRCLSQLGRVDVEAQKYTLEGLTEALIMYFHPSGSQQK